VKSLDGVSTTHLTQLAQYLINRKSVGSLSDAFYLISGLRSLQGNPLGEPLAVSLERASIESTAKGSEGHLRVRVTDVFLIPLFPP